LYLITLWVQGQERRDIGRENEMNRLVPLIYNQLERYEKAMYNIDFEFNSSKGYLAIYKFSIEEIYTNKISENNEKFFLYFNGLYTAFSLIKKSVEESSVSIDDKKYLKSIFKLNVGDNHFEFLQNILRFYDMQKEHKDYFNNQIKETVKSPIISTIERNAERRFVRTSQFITEILYFVGRDT
jgi:hypothetical protein